MIKKIVAIGGGENGRVNFDGSKEPYETRLIDQEVIKLTNKTNPNFLFIGHALLEKEIELAYFKTMKQIYESMYGCNCNLITRNELLTSFNQAKALVDWADIIYIGGGSTYDMMELWKKTNFNQVLKHAWESGKVLCGLSAGANSFF